MQGGYLRKHFPIRFEKASHTSSYDRRVREAGPFVVLDRFVQGSARGWRAAKCKCRVAKCKDIRFTFAAWPRASPPQRTSSSQQT
jgi:hypothetical protein